VKERKLEGKAVKGKLLNWKAFFAGFGIYFLPKRGKVHIAFIFDMPRSNNG